MLKMINPSNPGIFYSGEIGEIFRDYFLFASSLYSTPQKESSKEKFNRSIEKRVLFIYLQRKCRKFMRCKFPSTAFLKVELEL